VEVAPGGAEDQDLLHPRSPFSLKKNFSIHEIRNLQLSEKKDKYSPSKALNQ
jgi:hypothetical protein